jgi:hypothetical protein
MQQIHPTSPSIPTQTQEAQPFDQEMIRFSIGNNVKLFIHRKKLQARNNYCLQQADSCKEKLGADTAFKISTIYINARK